MLHFYEFFNYTAILIAWKGILMIAKSPIATE
jgi:hypothetical protein